MTKFQSQVHALFPSPVGSYSGFAHQNELQEKLLGLLTVDQIRRASTVKTHNCADVGASQAPHSHENSWISGTYYVCFEGGMHPSAFGAWRFNQAVPTVMAVEAQQQQRR